MQILEIFNDIEHQALVSNYFAIRESMKLEYEILEQHEDLQAAFVENPQYLCQCMQNFSAFSESITYEALLLMSFFLIRKPQNENVRLLLKDNAPKLITFVEEFTITEVKELEMDNFDVLKVKMLERLKVI